MVKNEKTTLDLDVHLREWREISIRFKLQMSHILEVQEIARKSIKPILDAQSALQRTLKPILIQQDHWKKFANAMPRLDFPDSARITIQTAEFQKSIHDLVAPAFKELQKSFHELPPRTREALLLLGDHGWFLDLEIPLPGLWTLKKALENGEVKDAEDALVEYFENRLETIKESIIERFPHRAHLIKAAFNAHQRQEYELSIPVLLAQTDGICKEVVNQYFFLKKNKKPRTARYVEQIVADTYKAALLSPLAQTLPINASESERPNGFDALNRHMVLHGESLDYGSKINSLKAISLINYVSHVLEGESK